jgi:hypothetical protein
MKLLFSFALIFFSVAVNAQSDSLRHQADPRKRVDTVDVSCGQCNFKLKTQKGCDLAVRINGKAYFVDGTKIDDHGDAHASDGFCSAVRKAKVQGEVVDGRFKASYFVLLPTEKVKPQSD